MRHLNFFSRLEYRSLGWKARSARATARVAPTIYERHEPFRCMVGATLAVALDRGLRALLADTPSVCYSEGSSTSKRVQNGDSDSEVPVNNAEIGLQPQGRSTVLARSKQRARRGTDKYIRTPWWRLPPLGYILTFPLVGLALLIPFGF